MSSKAKPLDDTDPDVPKLRRVLKQLQALVKEEEVTPALANQVLGNYAEDLRHPGRRTQTRRRATHGPLTELKLRY